VQGSHAGHRTAGTAVRVLTAAVLLLVPALLGVVPPATASGGSSEAADGTTTFTVGLLNEVDSFNPFLGIEATSYEMWALSYDLLVGYSMKDLSPVPSLAESWDTSDDGLTWTFHVRDGVSWSDGEPLTAHDVAYTFNRVLDGGPEAVTWGSYLTSVQRITAPDDGTVVMRLKQPNAVLPLLPIPIVPEHVWKDVSEKEVKTYPAEPTDGQPVVGSGPFRLVEGTAGGSTYRFEANPDYWQGTPHVDEVVFRVFKAEDPAVQALVKGEVDFVHNITPVQVAALQGRDGITAINGISNYFTEIAFNTGAVDTGTGKPLGDGNPALKDPAFRHALGYALDLDRVVQNAFQGGGKPGDTVVPPAYPNFKWDPPEDEAFTFDLDKAGQLLDAAGYEKGPDGLRTMPDGTPIGTLRLFARPEEKSSLRTMDLFSEWLGDLGIDTEVKVVESNRLTNLILDGEYDAFEWGWYVEPDPDSMLVNFTCDERGGWSDSWYCNPEYDRLMTAQNRELDGAKRVDMIRRMQQILYRDSPYLVTAYTTTGQAVRTDRFACFQPQPDPGGTLLVQYGAHNYYTLRPADEAGDCDGVTSAVGATVSGQPAEDGRSTVVLVAGGVLLLAALAAGGFWAFRRRTTAGERE
jgi:peptide/nickel transport system substrate-binding protein